MHSSCPSLSPLPVTHDGFVSHELLDLGKLALVGAGSDPQLEIEQQEHGALQSQTLINEQTRKEGATLKREANELVAQVSCSLRLSQMDLQRRRAIAS